VWPSGDYDLASLEYRFYSNVLQSTQDAFHAAAVNWENASGSPVDFILVSVPAWADVRCYDDYNPGLPYTSGKTFFFGSFPSICYVECWFNEYVTPGYSSGKRTSVGAHEFGHATTLAHRFGTVMTDDDWWRWDYWHYESPTSVDISTLNAHY
jgi:hypothetical protein